MATPPKAGAVKRRYRGEAGGGGECGGAGMEK